MTSHLLPVEIASLQHQLTEARENLRVIDERISQYVMSTEVNPQYIKEQRHWQARIAELEQQLAHPATPSIFEAADYAEVRARYLAALRERYGVVQTHAFMNLAQDAQVGNAKQLPLLGERGVYVPLRFSVPNVRGEAVAEPDQRQLKREWRNREAGPREWLTTLADVLGLRGHLAIIGDAGAGKTTLLHVILTALTTAEPSTLLALDQDHQLPPPYPLPVLLPLRQFELACNQERGQRTVADLLRFVDDWFTQWCDCGDLPSGWIAAHIRSGRAWLLLDALDEVADPDHRLTVRNVIQELAQSVPLGTRLIVTARVAGYRGHELNDRFTVVTVRDLDDDQRTQMIQTLYANLALPDAVTRAADLIGRFNASENLRHLGRTPVMVWTAAVIHALRGELPEGRAALYDAYVEILLKHSFKLQQGDVAAVNDLTDGRGWSIQDRRYYLTYAAFEVHRLLEGDAERRAAGRTFIGEDELADRILAEHFLHEHVAKDRREARQKAHAYLDVMVSHSGLIDETPQGYTIGDHLTMQEFLAGCYVGDELPQEDRDAFEDFLRDKVGESWWREVFLLAAGFLAGKTGFAARNFLRQIARQGETPERQLAALALAARGLLQLRRLRQPPAWYAPEAATLADKLYQRLFAHPIDAPAPVRHDAGLALGLLYGYPAEESDLHDPRCAYPQGLPDFKRIEAGWFWMGEDDSDRDDEKPRHRVYVDVFEMARFPVTNAMYARFIDAGGYANPEWWAAAITDNYWKEGKVQDWTGGWYDLPRYWDDVRFNNPLQPVVGANWYEAVAYAAWLTATLNDGRVYRLPTEAEWEKAARTPTPSPPPSQTGEGVKYPWGQDWQADHCNTQEAGLDTTSPVGIFPLGATATGLEDMAGNVWEWCADWYGAYKAGEVKNPPGPKKGDGRVLRGGGWATDNGADVSRCGYRVGFDPWLWDVDWGFRLARISP